MRFTKAFKTLVVFMGLGMCQLWGWGATGHRVVGHIATQYLNAAAAQELQRILGPESLAIASTYMDEIKSETSQEFRQYNPWHYTTIPDGQTYETAEKSERGEVVGQIHMIIEDLKSGNLDPEKEKRWVRFLVHLVGDLHQPMHVGNGKDRGGNDIKITWFGDDSNLHRLWDSDMINSTRFSYTELARKINHPTAQDIKAWQSTSVVDWAEESRLLRLELYKAFDADVFEGKKKPRLSYRYSYEHMAQLELRLLQAGVRLAGLFNEIYGGVSATAK